MNQEGLELFGASFYSADDRVTVEAREDDLYYYRAYFGTHDITVDHGDCLYWYDGANAEAVLQRGPVTVSSPTFAVLVRGYMPENKRSGISTKTYLPYVNGCSSK